MIKMILTNWIKLFRKAPFCDGLYYQNFKKALCRNKRLGLIRPKIQISNQQILTEENIKKLGNFLSGIFTNLPPSRVAGQCFRINKEILSDIQNLFGCNAYFTQGSITTTSATPGFLMNESDARELLRFGMKKPLINTHVWLTLETMEIIDITYMTTVAIAKRDNRFLGGIVANNPDKLAHEWQYEPFIIGDEFLHKVGAFDLYLTQLEQ